MKFGKKQIWSIFAVLVFGVAVCLAGLHTGRTEDAVNMENAGATKMRRMRRIRPSVLLMRWEMIVNPAEQG